MISDTIAEVSEEFDIKLDVPSSLGSAILAGGRTLQWERSLTILICAL